MSPPHTQATKAGYLDKKGHKTKNWRRRYVVWSPLQKSIIYYTDDRQAEEKGTLGAPLLSASVLMRRAQAT